MNVTIKSRAALTLAQIERLAHGNFQAFAENMLARAKDHPDAGGAPVDTGNLRDSLRLEMKGGKGVGFRLMSATAQRRSDTGNLGYGYFVHEGSSRREANPFFDRAFKASRGDFEQAWR